MHPLMTSTASWWNADTLALGASASNGVRVRVPRRLPDQKQSRSSFSMAEQPSRGSETRTSCPTLSLCHEQEVAIVDGPEMGTHLLSQAAQMRALGRLMAGRAESRKQPLRVPSVRNLGSSGRDTDWVGYLERTHVSLLRHLCLTGWPGSLRGNSGHCLSPLPHRDFIPDQPSWRRQCTAVAIGDVDQWAAWGWKASRPTCRGRKQKREHDRVYRQPRPDGVVEVETPPIWSFMISGEVA